MAAIHGYVTGNSVTSKDKPHLFPMYTGSPTQFTGSPTQVHRVPNPGSQGLQPRFTGSPTQVHRVPNPVTNAQSKHLLEKDAQGLVEVTLLHLHLEFKICS